MSSLLARSAGKGKSYLKMLLILICLLVTNPILPAVWLHSSAQVCLAAGLTDDPPPVSRPGSGWQQRFTTVNIFTNHKTPQGDKPSEPDPPTPTPPVTTSPPYRPPNTTPPTSPPPVPTKPFVPTSPPTSPVTESPPPGTYPPPTPPGGSEPSQPEPPHPPGTFEPPPDPPDNGPGTEDPPPLTEIPYTGDSANPLPWMIILLLSTFALRHAIFFYDREEVVV